MGVVKAFHPQNIAGGVARLDSLEEEVREVTFDIPGPLVPNYHLSNKQTFDMPGPSLPNTGRFTQ